MKICIALDRSIKANRDKYSGILRYAAEAGDWEIRTLNPHDRHIDRRCAELFASWIPDGFIGSGSVERVARNLRKIHPRVRPRIAYIDGTSDPVDAEVVVRADNAAIARCAAQRLLACGYRSFAYVGTDLMGECRFSKERQQAFLAVFRGVEYKTDSFMPDGKSGRASNDTERFATWLARLEKPCGIMAYHDETAQIVYDACRLAHIRIPDEIALVGVDNDLAICENMDPTLTSVLPDFEGAGYLAAHTFDRALTRRRNGRPILAKYAVKSLVERLSTQDTFKNGRIVALAKDYIRRHVQDGIRVRDVVAAAKVSPRILEMRFRQTLNRSIRDEIQHVRFERLLNLLETTNRPAGDLIQECGFSSASNAATLFRKRLGTTLTAYRNRKSPIGP